MHLSIRSIISRFVKGSPLGDGIALAPEERPYANVSFSQFGEDLAVLRHFVGRTGFYVDVGAHHPIRFSNTHLLYRQGWSGINIDANPESIRLFHQMRPRDVNIHAALSDKVQQVEFSLYEESALSRIEVTEGAAARGNSTLPTPTKKIVLQTTTLEKLLAGLLPAGKTVDFLNVDCEGHDLAVLSSNDWGRIRPEVVAVEDWETTTPSEIDRFFWKLGYALVFLQLPAKLFVRGT